MYESIKSKKIWQSNLSTSYLHMVGQRSIVVIAKKTKNNYRGGQKTNKFCWTYTRAIDKENLS